MGFRPRRRALHIFLALLGVLFTSISSPIAFAESVSGTMPVSAVVIARAVVTVYSQPDVVNVTDADIARGYVDVPSPILLLARTNSRAGYLLQVNRVADSFTNLYLTFGDSQLSVAGEAWISRPYVPGGESLTILARVHLASGVQPGSYPLPMAISVRPL